MKNNRFRFLIASVAVMCLMLCFAGCGSSAEEEESSSTTAEETTAAVSEGEVIYDDGDKARDSEEAFDQKLISKAESVTNEDAKALNSDAANFYGSWTATSDKAKFYYGNLDITINKDGTFDANVTGDELKGTWTKTDYGIHIDEELLSGVMYYGDGGKMIIDEDDMKIVLTKR